MQENELPEKYQAVLNHCCVKARISALLLSEDTFYVNLVILLGRATMVKHDLIYR